MKNQYLSNLDGLRFIAAITVAFSHLETMKRSGASQALQNRFVENAPQIAVTFFFVLSGFLIMWWFLGETKGNVHEIDIRTFYINRISRTWPLYYLIVCISLIIGCINGSFFVDELAPRRFICYFLFLPNTANILFGADIYLGQTWSLAVEEFFYILFPLVLIKTPRYYLIKMLIAGTCVFGILSMIFNPVFFTLINWDNLITPFIRHLITFFERYRIYSFLLGAIGAYLLYFKNLDLLRISKRSYRNIMLFSSLFTIVMFLWGITFSFATQQVYSLLFAVILLLLSYNGYSNTLLNSRLFSTGGKISYGIYMLHMLVVMRIINQLSSLIPTSNIFLATFVSWTLLLLFTWVISYVSYTYFENPLRIWMRKKFANVKDKRQPSQIDQR
jgi:peptidoglycan/LPS O-acetylase OafA/YrhL